MRITSRTNETVKAARALWQAKSRRQTGLHLVEGEKLVREAIASACSVVRLFAEEGFDAPDCGGETVTVSRSVMEALCESKTPQHLAAVVRTPAVPLPDAFPQGLIVVLDRVQDAGNLGTVLRTADAFGAAGVFVGEGCADPYAGKTLRAAMGSTYHLPVWQGDVRAALDRLLAGGFTCLCGHLRGSETLPVITPRMALIIGNEGSGVSDAVAERCCCYRLPMRGRAESLNAAMAAGILIYELTNRMG